MAHRCKPWLPNAQTIASLSARDAERDDEFGSVAELKRVARRESKAHGHELGHFAFKGSRNWLTTCARCINLVLVNDERINYFGHLDCPPCVERYSELNRVLGSGDPTLA